MLNSNLKIGHGLKSKTQLTSFSIGQWLGRGANITVVDTPGFKVLRNFKLGLDIIAFV